jgi:hypothetical protein
MIWYPSKSIEECNQTYDIVKRVRAAAYLRWLDAGCPEGRDCEFWYGAERENTNAEIGCSDCLSYIPRIQHS